VTFAQKSRSGSRIFQFAASMVKILLEYRGHAGHDHPSPLLGGILDLFFCCFFLSFYFLSFFLTYSVSLFVFLSLFLSFFFCSFFLSSFLSFFVSFVSNLLYLFLSFFVCFYLSFFLCFFFSLFLYRPISKIRLCLFWRPRSKLIFLKLTYEIILFVYSFYKVKRYFILQPRKF
jgi:hypothetical protein